MKRNTYVTATLFVVFGLLTVAYWQMGDRLEPEIPIVGQTGNLNPPGDVATIGEVSTDSEECLECEETEETIADAADEVTQEKEEEVMAEADNEDESSSDTPSREVISTLDAMRFEMENGRDQQVAVLTEMIASADVTPEIKSEAKDSLNDLQTLATSSRMLETVIGHMGFDDVLVHATTDFVRVAVAVSTIEDVPTREELAELYVLAGIEFGNHRNGNITIEFQPLN